MRMVAIDGTAGGIFGPNYPVSVAAKTGTAQTDKHNASDNGAFVCYAPFDDPQIAVVVYGEKAGGGTTVGRIGKAILDTYFNISDSDSGSNGENQLG
jgi:penicillin-binding protein 2